jgi:hypothetical protein
LYDPDIHAVTIAATQPKRLYACTAREVFTSSNLVPSRFVLEFDWPGLRLDEDIGSSSEVNRLGGEFLGQGLPSVDFAHDDLTSGEQCPEQHGCGLGGGQHRLGLDAALEVLMEPFDRVGGARALPLAERQLGKGEEPLTGLLEAVGDRPESRATSY